MKGLELIRAAMRLQETDRAPWVPFVGIHGGFLIGKDAESYLKSPVWMAEGIGRAIETYDPDGIPVIFDLQLEAEILGCTLKWSPGTPPAVISHPLSEGRKIIDLPPFDARKGRIPAVVEATRLVREKYPDVALYGLITGPFTLALHLLGTEIFLKLYEAPDEVAELMEFCTGVAVKMADYLSAAGCDACRGNG